MSAELIPSSPFDRDEPLTPAERYAAAAEAERMLNWNSRKIRVEIERLFSIGTVSYVQFNIWNKDTGSKVSTEYDGPVPSSAELFSHWLVCVPDHLRRMVFDRYELEVARHIFGVA